MHDHRQFETHVAISSLDGILGDLGGFLPQEVCQELRVRVVGSEVSVWLNPMWTDTQAAGTAAGGAPATIADMPRLKVTDPAATSDSDAPVPPGGLAIAVAGGSANVDYVSILDPALL